MMEKTYHESDWVMRRWDWFNDGRIVEPLSFCQFWRTVLLYATVKQLLWPVHVTGRLAARFQPNFTVPRPVSAVGRLLVRIGRPLGLGLSRAFWLLIYPLRLFAPPVGRTAFISMVTVGEPIAAFGQRNKSGLMILGLVVLVPIVLAGWVLIVYAIISTFLTSWFWTLIAIGSGIGGGFALYGFFKSGAPGLILGMLGLLWDASVAAKHGICPPVKIVREEKR